MLRPPVRTAFPGGARHEAALLERRTIAVGAPADDPVRSVLDAEAGTVEGEPADAERMLFDLGRIAAGTVSLRVSGAAPGTVVDVAASEHLDARRPDRAARPARRASATCAAAASRPRSSSRSTSSAPATSSPWCARPTARRRPEVELAVTDRLRPRPEGASFECSDPLLNRVHAVGLRTVDLCALDAYVDCPTREQRAWTGDSVVHQMVDLVSNPDWSMAVWHPQLAAAPRADGMLAMAVASDFAADDRMFIPDWSLHWLHSVHNLYRYTGDRDLVAELLPVGRADDALVRVLPGRRRPAPRRLRVGADRLGQRLRQRAARRSSTACGPGRSRSWPRSPAGSATRARRPGPTSRYEGVKAGFDVFWDEGRGSYVDHVVDGVARRPMSQHGGATALAAGLVPADRVDRVLDRILDRSRLLRHSCVMYPSPPTVPTTATCTWPSATPSPTWDVEEAVIEAEPFFRYVRARRRGPGRTTRPDRRPVPRLEGVPRRRRTSRGPSAGPAARTATAGRRPRPATSSCTPSASRRPSPATPRCGWCPPSATSTGPGPPCPRRTARSPSRPTPTAAW